MANSFEIIKYKQLIASKLLESEKIVNLLHIEDEELESPDDLIGTHIFNFVRYPNAPEDETCFICVEVNIPTINTMFSSIGAVKKLEIVFYIVCHERLMPTENENGATRTDLIGAEIDRIFNGARHIGLTPMTLISNDADAISVKHRLRTLVFETDDFNNDRCKGDHNV